MKSWRGGEDHDFGGVGSWRQKSIDHRDRETYRMTVQRGPLSPIHSLMLHGMIYAKQARNPMTDPNNEFPEEVQPDFAVISKKIERPIQAAPIVGA